MVFFGDPTHVANLTYDKGTSIKNGVSPAPSPPVVPPRLNNFVTWDCADI